MIKYILGVKIDDLSSREVLEKVALWVKGKEKKYIVTTNPEFVLSAQSDIRFKNILNNSDLSIPDGNGLRLSGKVKNLVTGVDLMQDIIKMAADRNWKVGLLGGQDGVVRDTKKVLQERFPKLNISFAEEGGKVDKDGNMESKILSKESCDLVFVAFGHPKQEFWISKNLNNFPAKLFIGVGGAYDYISQRVPRAPLWARNLRLEWLFRLVYQPWRFRRQVRLLKFLWLILLDRK